MPRRIEIQLLGGFSITADGVAHDNLSAKSRRGVSLMTYLILQRGKPVAVQRLARELWGARRSDNPENALKTLISRQRALLNSVAEGLGSAIRSEQGAYRWENPPGVTVDALEFIDLAEQFRQPVPEPARWEKSRRVLALYRGGPVPDRGHGERRHAGQLAAQGVSGGGIRLCGIAQAAGRIQ